MQNRVLQFMEDLNSRDLSKLAPWFHTESKVWIPPCGAVTGNTRIIALFRAIFRKYNSLSWKVIKLCPIEENCCIYFSESWGLINDTDYTNYIITEIIFNEQGQINFLSDYFKDTSKF